MLNTELSTSQTGSQEDADLCHNLVSLNRLIVTIALPEDNLKYEAR